MFTIKFGITLLYSIPSMIMYLLTVLMVRKNWKEFSVTFSKLYIVFFVFNNITFFNSFITVRIPQNTCGNCTMSFLFKAHTRENLSWFPLNVFSFVHYMMAYIQFSMIFLTSLNRFTMIFWIRSYEEVWNRFFILIIVLTIAIPVPLTLHILTNTTYYTYTETLDCFIVGSTVDRTSAYTRLLAFFGTVTFLTAIINFASFCKLACMPNNVTAAERNLVFVSGSLFVVQFAAVINTTVNRMFVNDSNKNTAWAQVAATLLPYVSDGLTLIHPWMFLAFSRTARRCLRTMYIPGASSVVPVRQVSGTNRSNVETHKF